MSAADSLYAEIKPDIDAVATPLFDLSEVLLRKHGNFLPHATVLMETGEVKVVGAKPDSKNDRASSADVLPMLHDGLRIEAQQSALKAVGVAENVTITLEGQRSTKAIKVLVEHRRGFTVALYLPFEKKLLKGYVLGSTVAMAANPEVNAWAQSAS